MMIGVKGKQLCAGNPNVAGRTDGQMDMVIPVYPPPNLVAGGIIKKLTFLVFNWVLMPYLFVVAPSVLGKWLLALPIMG